MGWGAPPAWTRLDAAGTEPVLWPHFTVVLPTFPCVCPVQPHGVGGWLRHAVAPQAGLSGQRGWSLGMLKALRVAHTRKPPALTSTSRHPQEQSPESLGRGDGSPRGWRRLLGLGDLQAPGRSLSHLLSGHLRAQQTALPGPWDQNHTGFGHVSQRLGGLGDPDSPVQVLPPPERQEAAGEEGTGAEENPVHHGVPSRPDTRETRVHAGVYPAPCLP